MILFLFMAGVGCVLIGKTADVLPAGERKRQLVGCKLACEPIRDDYAPGAWPKAQRLQ